MVHKECYYTINTLKQYINRHDLEISRLKGELAELKKQVDLLHDKLRREQFECLYTGQEVYY